MEKRIEKWESLRLEAQKFMPQEYCKICVPKYTDIYEYVIAENPTHLPSSTHFYKDSNNNHILDDEEKNSTITTNSAAYNHVNPGANSFYAWRTDDLQRFWAVVAQNPGQLALFETQEVYVSTKQNFS